MTDRNTNASTSQRPIPSHPIPSHPIPSHLNPKTQRGGPNPALSGSGGLRGQPPPTPTFDASSLPASEAALRKRLSMDGGGGNGNNLMSPPAAKRPAGSSGSGSGGAPFMSPPAGGMPTPAPRPAALGSGSGATMPRATPSAVSPGSLQSPPPAGDSGLAPGQAYAQRANSGQRVVEMNPNLAPTRGATQPSKR